MVWVTECINVKREDSYPLVVPYALAQAALVGEVPCLHSALGPFQIVDAQSDGQGLSFRIPTRHLHDSISDPAQQSGDDVTI